MCRKAEEFLFNLSVIAFLVAVNFFNYLLKFVLKLLPYLKKISNYGFLKKGGFDCINKCTLLPERAKFTVYFIYFCSDALYLNGVPIPYIRFMN